MFVKLLVFFMIMFTSTVHAESDKCAVPKEEPKQEKKAEKPDVHAPMSMHFLDRRPYMAPKKK